jgi:hypothetical protein
VERGGEAALFEFLFLLLLDSLQQHFPGFL